MLFLVNLAAKFAHNADIFWVLTLAINKHLITLFHRLDWLCHTFLPFSWFTTLEENKWSNLTAYRALHFWVLAISRRVTGLLTVLLTILFPFSSRYIISNYLTVCQIIFYNKIGREVPLTLWLNRAYETPWDTDLPPAATMVIFTSAEVWKLPKYTRFLFP